MPKKFSELPEIEIAAPKFNLGLRPKTDAPEFTNVVCRVFGKSEFDAFADLGSRLVYPVKNTNSGE